jgi:DNA-binding response OmpR family regulator
MADKTKSSPEILVIEDEPLIAMFIEDVLAESGFTIAGPFETVADAADAARRFDGAAALVDLTLRDGDAGMIARTLESRNIPFAVMTGRGEAGTLSAPLLRKPFLIGDLLETIRSLVP